jgi:predicted transcriptional regulator
MKPGQEVAVKAAERGWAVVKIVPGTKKGAESWGELDWRSPAEIERLWAGQQYAVGILTGPSRLVDDDLDVDDEGNPVGEWSLEGLADGDWDNVPATFTMASPSGGKHLVWRQPAGREFKTCSGQVADHIDVRGRGGLFVMWDPHKRYVVTDDRDPVVMPTWLADLHPVPGSLNGRRAVSIPDIRAWLEDHGNGEPCDYMRRVLDERLAKADEDGAVVHDVMIETVNAVVGECIAGHPGLNSVLSVARNWFMNAMRGKQREHDKVPEWRGAVSGAIRNKVGVHGVTDGDPCKELASLSGKDDPVKKQRSLMLLQGMRNGAWLTEQEFPPLKWAVPNLLPEGVVLLVGKPKIGKSTLIRRIGLETSRGGYVFGIKCDQIDTLYFALEDDDPSMQDGCFELLGEGVEIPEAFSYMTEIRPGKLIETVAAYLNTVELGLVVVDTLGRAMEPAKHGETTYERDYRVMTMLKSIARKHPGSTIVITHHDRKGKSEDWVDAVSGTSAIAGAADTVIYISRKRGDNIGLWQATSRKRMDDASYAIILERPHGWHLDGEDLDAAAESASDLEPTRRDSLGDRSQDIIDFVEGNQNGVGIGEVAKALNLNVPTAKTYLNRLWRGGYINKMKRGLYGPAAKSKVGGDKNDD